MFGLVEFVPRGHLALEFIEHASRLIVRGRAWHPAVQRCGGHPLPSQPAVDVTHARIGDAVRNQTQAGIDEGRLHAVRSGPDVCGKAFQRGLEAITGTTRQADASAQRKMTSHAVQIVQGAGHHRRAGSAVGSDQAGKGIANEGRCRDRALCSAAAVWRKVRGQA